MHGISHFNIGRIYFVANHGKTTNGIGDAREYGFVSITQLADFTQKLHTHFPCLMTMKSLGRSTFSSSSIHSESARDGTPNDSGELSA